MKRRPLPPELGATFSTARAASVGVHPKRLDAGDLTATFRGMRTTLHPTSHSEIARAALTVMPHDALFSHVTAARLAGVPLPAGTERAEELHVTLPRKGARWRHAGFVEHHADRSASLVDGLPVVTAAETWVDLAPMVSVTDLVVAGDHLLGAGMVSWEELQRAVAERRGARGLSRSAAALLLVRCGSASPMETRARLAFARWSLPEPELNADVHDAHGGWIARVDFLWRRQRVIGEYYGAVHGDTWSRDLTRVAQLEDAGYRVVVMTSRDLRAGAGDLRARLRRLLQT